MGREVRRVPPNWQHPSEGFARDGSPRYIALLAGPFEERAREWDEGCAAWDRGEFPDYASEESRRLTYEEWNGERPKPEDYMPSWSSEEATHLMMYETCSEGTPISPAFSTPEELARWLADNNASAFGGMTAPYEAWLRVARGGYACSAVICDGAMQSGVEGLSEGGAS